MITGFWLNDLVVRVVEGNDEETIGFDLTWLKHMLIVNMHSSLTNKSDVISVKTFNESGSKDHSIANS